MNISKHQLENGTPWWIIAPENSEKPWIVLWIYGFTSSAGKHQERCVRMADRSNVAHALLDYSGHGLNPIKLSEATRKQQFEEVAAVYDELVKMGYNKVIVSGGSFGGYMAAQLAGNKQPEAAVLRAPANYPDSEWETPYSETGAAKDRDKEFRKNYTANFTNNAVKSVAKFKGKTWVMEHELDDVIPKTIPRSYYNAAKNPCGYIVIQGLGHTFRKMDNPSKFFTVIEDLVAGITEEVMSTS